MRNTNYVKIYPMNKQPSPSPVPRPSSEDLVDALVPVAFATMAVLNRIGAENDLSLSLLRVLGILRDRRPRMAELADHLGLERQTMSGLIARAQARGLVARAASADDGRATDVFLTPEGAALVDQLHARTREALAPMTGALGARERQQLQSLLQRMHGPPGAPATALRQPRANPATTAAAASAAESPARGRRAAPPRPGP